MSHDNGTPPETPPVGGEEGQTPAPFGLDRRSLVERVRAWVEFRLQESSLRELAQEVGIAKSTIDKFVVGLSIPEKTWPRLRAWYLADSQTRRASLHDPQSMAMLFLTTLENIPARHRAAAIRSTVDHLRALHAEASAPEPEWLDVLLGWAEEGAAIPQRSAPPPRKRRRKRRPHV